MGKEAAQQEGKWDGVLRRHFGITIRAVDEKARSVDVIASTDTLDSHGTILEQDWKLDRYLKNPVVLWNHNNFESSVWSFGGTVRPEDLLPIGRAENVGVIDGKLQATLVFATAESHSFADRIFRLFCERILHSVSVGFRPGTVTEEKVDGGHIYRLGRNELYEISAVPIPSNPDAIAKSIARDREHLGRLAARAAGVGEKETIMPMTAEEKAAFDAALVDAKDAKTRVATLEGDLGKERAFSAEARETIKLLTERASKAEDRIVEVEIDKLIGKKFYPAEREKQIELARKIGINQVIELAAARPDIKLTEPVRAGGKPLISANQPAPPASDDESARDASDEIHTAALAAANAAA